MHVLLVKRDAGVAGDTTYLLMLAEGLVSRGHRVTFAAGPGRMASRFRKVGANVWTLPPAPFATSFLKRWAKHAEIGAVVTAGRGSLRFAAYETADSLGVPCIATLQDHIEESQSVDEFQRCDAVVAVERPIIDRATELGVPTHKLAVWPRPVFQRELGPAPTEGFPILWMNRMSGSKAWSGEVLLAAAPTLAEQMPDARVQLVGGGSKAGRLRTLARKANRAIGHRFVTVEGFTSGPLAKMAAAALVIGGGYTALEALYNGRPTIAAGFGYQGPITQQVIADGYDRHFGDREPSGGPFSRVSPNDLAQAITHARANLSKYQPNAHWFPLDHSLVGQAERLEQLIAAVRRRPAAA